MDGTGGYHAEWSKSIRGQSSYGFTHTGNIKNSEWDFKGKEGKWVGKIRKGDKTWETPNSGKWTKCSGWGGGWRDVATEWWALGGHLMGLTLRVILYYCKSNLHK